MYDELINLLRRCGKQKCKNCEYEHVLGCVTKMNEKAADALEELNMELLNAKEFSDYADAIKEMKPKWISVSERLPMIGEKAICFGKNGYMIGTYGEFGWMFPCYFGGVTHWMPLPKAPEEGE